MSLEVWGDEGNIAPCGYVTEESYFEADQAVWELRRCLRHAWQTATDARPNADMRTQTMLDSIISNVDYYLNQHTPKIHSSETWQDAMAREDKFESAARSIIAKTITFAASTND